MGSKGNNRHVKRLAAQRYLHVERKVHAYVIKPDSGRHTLGFSIALATVLKEKLGIVANTREAKGALNAGGIEVNGRVVKNIRYPLGFGDTLHIKPSGDSYAIGVGRKGVVSVSKAQGDGSGSQTMKVIGKYIAGGNIEMLRLHSGTIVRSEKGAKVNDSVIVKDGKVEGILKLENGARCLVIRGIHASESGIIKEIKRGTALRSATVEIAGPGGKTETLLDNIIVVGGK